MGQRIDVNHLNIYYGDFLAVEDVNINIEANKVTAFIGPSGCGKSTVLRTLDRMHEIIPGAHCEGEVLLEGKNLYDKNIDAVAGPTEIGIIADKTADPSLLAADLIGQAEHDELAGSVLFTDSTEIAEKVQESLNYRVPRTEHAERVHTSLSGSQSAIVLTDSLDQSIDAANAYAAEHLEIQTADADAVVPRIKNAGAIFRGPYSPVPLGDYMSGSNHVLPTGGTARFAAGLGVHTFMKPVEVIEYDEEGLKALAARINAFAVSEDLPAHGECVLSRFVKDPYDKATLREQEKEAGLR